MVGALLEANQEGAVVKDSFGKLPWHLVATKQASVEVVGALLEANHEGFPHSC